MISKTSKNKFNFFQNYKKFFFLVSRERYSNDLGNIFGSIYLNKKFKLSPIIISDNRNSYDEFFKFFGFKKFEKIFQYKIIFTNIFIFINSLFYLLKCLIFISFKNFDWLIENFEVKSIKIGDLIYDTYIRDEHRYTSPKIDLSFINVAFKGIFRTLKCLKIYKIYNPKIILIGTDFFSHNSGIMMRIGIQKKLKVFECQPKFLDKNHYDNIKNGKVYLGKHFYKNKINKSLIKKHYLKKININSNKKKFDPKAFTNTYTFANRFKSHKFNKKKFLEKFCEGEKFKKIILIAPHVFSDVPHLQGKLLFRDFYNDFEETLKYVKNYLKEKKVLWISKSHPANFLYDEKNVYKQLFKKYKFRSLINCPKSINSRELTQICDNVITCKGSIGLEFAAEGKMPILSGVSAYSNLGFTFDPKSKDQFFNKLRNIENIKPLNKKQTMNARKAMYLLDNDKNKIYLDYNKSIMTNFVKMQEKWYQNLFRYKKNVSQLNYIKSAMKNIDKNKLLNDAYFRVLGEALDKNLK